MSRYQELSAQFYSNRLLFGDPAEPGIVAVEVATPTTVDIYRRSGGSLSSERRPIRLFALLEDVALLHGFRRETRVRPLAGDFRFRVMVEVGSLVLLEDLKRHLRATTSKPAAAPDAPYFVLADPIEQHLMLSGMTFFMGLEFADLRRLQLDIETYITPGFEFPSAARDTDRIVAISITDTGGLEQVLRGTEMDERAMLSELVRIIAERDPDIIEGHNLFRFDLEYIEARARRVGVKLALGRDGSTLRARPSRLQIAERSIQYRRYDITGRSIVDTWILAQHYDIASRELEGFGLKDLALHFGIAADSRTYLDAAKVSDYFDRDPETLYAYALDDARETRELAALLSPSYFVQAQIFPYSYQSAILRGNATKIDALMMRAYLREGHSIPEPQPVAPVVGGYTEIRRAGVAHNVLHCDVTSLYPSLMIQYRLAPQSDRLGVFLRLLEDLRSFRVQAKAAVKELAGIERRNLEALQQTFKILINSFYGYLGFSLGHFNDFAEANDVTRRGRELIQRAVGLLEGLDAQVIEVDTDGIYFVPPPAVRTESDADALVEKLASVLPEGIKLEIDGRYPSMLSYKMKNYVLLDETGEMTIRGSGLKSRGLERFQRRFMEEMFALLMADRGGEFAALYHRWLGKLERHEIGIDDLMKTETLQDSLESYRAKMSGNRRNVSAAYELALKSARRYQSGDQISYYVIGRSPRVRVAEAARLAADYDAKNPDENVAYYQSKLLELYEKFRIFADRPGLFPAIALESAEQQTGSLFDLPKPD